MQVLILRPENFEYVAKETGKTLDELKVAYEDGLRANKLVYIRLRTPWS